MRLYPDSSILFLLLCLSAHSCLSLSLVVFSGCVLFNKLVLFLCKRLILRVCLGLDWVLFVGGHVSWKKQGIELLVFVLICFVCISMFVR